MTSDPGTLAMRLEAFLASYDAPEVWCADEPAPWLHTLASDSLTLIRSQAATIEGLEAKFDKDFEDARAEGYEEGFDEGNRNSRTEEGKLWRSVTRWAVALGNIEEEAPDGHSADDMMQAILHREAHLQATNASLLKQIEDLREALTEIASLTQTEKLLWWQIRAREALAATKEGT